MIELVHGALRAQVSLKGAALNGLWCPDREGRSGNIVLGYPNDLGRETGVCYAGEIVGPLVNRTAGGTGTRDGIAITLAPNDRGNALHGGIFGTSTFDWEVIETTTTTAILGLDWHQEGYPGRLRLRAHYRLTADALEIRLTATTNEPTLVSLAPHPYFNLGTQPTVNDHQLTLAADRYLPVDHLGIVSPEAPIPVTEYDFRQPKILTQQVDNSFVLTDPAALTLCDPASGRRLRLETNQPCVQIYTGDYLCGAFTPRQGVAIEPQGYPNAANRPDFPGITLLPGAEYQNWSRWRLDLGDCA